MEQEIQNFIRYLHTEKQVSGNTEVSYERDLRKMCLYFAGQGMDDFHAVTAEGLSAYILTMEGAGLKPATVSRHIASIKAFFHYEKEQHKVEADPAAGLKSPKVEKRAKTTLNPDEIARFMAQPKGNSPKDLRDRAMLELLRATGIRVSELVTLRVSDLDMESGRVTYMEGKKERVIPLGKDAKEALERYLSDARPVLVGEAGNPWLFTNCSGQAMSRQGFWKLMKTYGKKAGIESEITPHILRNSFTPEAYAGIRRDAAEELPVYAALLHRQAVAQMS